MTHPTEVINGIPAPQVDNTLDMLGQLASTIATKNRGWRMTCDAIDNAVYLLHPDSLQSIKLHSTPANRVIAVALLARLNSGS